MPESWFLKIDGIAGEATDPAHKDAIELVSWSWGVTQSAGGGSGSGGGGGKPTFHDVHVVARISRASLGLFTACATGAHLKVATLSGVRNTGRAKGVDLLRYKLSDLVVTSVQQSDGAGEAPVEQFSLNYAKIEISYTALDPSGKPLPPIEAGYDVKANKTV